MAASLAKDASVVPDYLLSPNTRDDFILVVEGVELHVSKGALGQVSEPLEALVFGDFREGNAGRSDLDGKRLEDVVAFLIWLCRMDPHEEDPKAEDKTYSKVGKLLCIAMEDIPGIFALAKEWQIPRLRYDCRQIFNDYCAQARENGKVPLKALDTLEALLGIENEQLSDFLNALCNTGVTVTDVCNVSASDAFRLRLFELVTERMAEIGVGRCFFCGEFSGCSVEGTCSEHDCTPEPCQCPGATNER